MSETDSLEVLAKNLGNKELAQQVKECKLLLVGAGGIGSEILKNLLLMGFKTITVIDLDTIDVSNLNRQFLFNRQHVGQSKAKIAAAVAVENFALDPSVTVTPKHDSIFNSEFDIDFYKSFTLVVNALDNKSARSQVNRMCLRADVPLIESGSEGYMGQAFLIKKGLTQCYECEGPKRDGRSYASCTIRNTPSLPIHCIVWAKHLFTQLFGEVDISADNDVSPDMNDPELKNGTENNGEATESKTNGTTHVSTREWAQECGYNSKQLFDKFFGVDVESLLKMDKLWESRQKPFPITYDKVMSNEIEFNQIEGSSGSAEANGSGDGLGLEAQKLWSMKECLNVFDTSIETLKKKLAETPDSEHYLVWDKDDEPALDFVTAVSNLRSFCFHIPRKSKFDVKSMAGNIIPAISSTNSIVGGIMGLQCLRVLENLIPKDDNKTKEEKDKELRDLCRHVYVRKVGPSAKNMISSYDLLEPNPNCLICSNSAAEIELSLSISETLLISDFIDQIIIGNLHFVCPDVYIEDHSVILFSKDDFDEGSDEDRQKAQSKFLSEYNFIADKTRLRVTDLIQKLEIFITLRDEKIDKNENDGLFYRIVNTKEALKSTVDENNGNKENEPNVQSIDDKEEVSEIPEKERIPETFTVEDDESDKTGEEMEGVEVNNSEDVEEVTISDSESDSDIPVVIDDDSVDIIEVREKRKIDSDIDDNSVIKKIKN